jgi:putative flavoprotein involved in K+ transport
MGSPARGSPPAFVTTRSARSRGTLGRVRVVVIGAGPAGLATAAELRRRGLRPLVLERGDGVGAAWRGRYDSLHLHTIRAMSGLPRMPIPRSNGRWVARDALVRYLERYAAENDVDVRTRTTATRVDRADGAWRVTTSGGGFDADAVVVATGYSNEPFLPDWPGRESFAGELVHSADYRNAEPYRGRDVLVVGAGNSGAEIATGLADGGAQRVRLSVRTPPQIVRRTRFGVPAHVVGLLAGVMPRRTADAIGLAMRRLSVPDLGPFGLPFPAVGPVTAFNATGNPPIVDVGIIAAVSEGRVEVVPAVESFRRDGVVLSDGSVITPDAVIAATGFRTALEPLVGHLGVLDSRGLPRALNARTDPRTPHLYFVGFRPYLGGLLWEASRGSRSVARAITRAAARDSRAARPRPA